VTKILTLVKPRPGMSAQAFREYWRGPFSIRYSNSRGSASECNGSRITGEKDKLEELRADEAKFSDRAATLALMTDAQPVYSRTDGWLR
jgi:hypothetical protein